MTAVAATAALLALLAGDAREVAVGPQPTTDIVFLRGKPQTVRLLGPRDGWPVIVSSGDGGWMHLGPQVAEFLASEGFFVVGFDVKAYLSSFTSGRTTLRVEDEPGDYAALVDYARQGSARRVLLVGVSEGAGLSLLAATDPRLQPRLAGVVGLGLGDLNELGWRWRDALIYLTHGTPDEPTFSASSVAGRVAPVPLAAVHSTRDEYVSVSELERVLAAAREPKRLWLVEASNHRFSDNTTGLEACLREAITWIRSQREP